ncbi:hypothetical protein R6Z07M_012329 [Ovis aries]
MVGCRLPDGPEADDPEDKTGGDRGWGLRSARQDPSNPGAPPPPRPPRRIGADITPSVLRGALRSGRKWEVKRRCTVFPPHPAPPRLRFQTGSLRPSGREAGEAIQWAASVWGRGVAAQAPDVAAVAPPPPRSPQSPRLRAAAARSLVPAQALARR